MAEQKLVDLLVPLLGVAATVAGIVFWRMFTRMESKIDRWWEEHLLCRDRQQKEFVAHSEFFEWKKGRSDIWKRLHGHKHDPAGRVTITEP